jgi:hypothetical protein
MISRRFAKILGALLLCFAVCGTASAQYGGGSTGGTGGAGNMGSGATGTTPAYSYGNGKAIGIGVGVAAGAAVGVALLIHHHRAAARSEASVIGCTQSMFSGITLKNEKDDQTYTILPGDTPLQAGERVELKGVASEDGSAGTHVFHVRSVVNNYGTCGPTSAAAGKSTGELAQVASK